MTDGTDAEDAIRELIAHVQAISGAHDVTVDELIEEGRRHPMTSDERARLLSRIAERLEERAQREGPDSAAGRLLAEARRRGVLPERGPRPSSAAGEAEPPPEQLIDLAVEANGRGGKTDGPISGRLDLLGVAE